MTPDQIERETVIHAPVERVWSVLTEAEHLSGWFAEQGAEIDLRPGGLLTMHWNEMPTTRARVEVVEPPHRFAYRWTAHFAAADEPAAGNSTLVEFTLIPDGDGTRLRVVESGFATLAVGDDERKRNYDDNVGGWKIVLEQFEAHIAQVAA
jgi:uncharacterized protein YndB with AHSA1/START domain